MQSTDVKEAPSSTTLHGVFVDVRGIGVLLSGRSGIGKSELALGLINCGHRLIADDSVIFTRENQSEKIVGSCPDLLQDFLEVRGLGVLNIRAMFGDTAIKERKQLQLIINVVKFTAEELQSIDRLHGVHTQRTILETVIPSVSIPVAPGRNMDILVEAAVRNQVLKISGYTASEEFTTRQRAKLAEKKEPHN